MPRPDFRPRPKSAAELDRICDRFNKSYPVGTPVQFFNILPGDGEPGSKPVSATIRSPAYVLSGHSPVVFLDGVSGCVHVNHVFPAPKEVPA